MKEDNNVLTRHEVVGLLEETIYKVEGHLDTCYLADQLSKLAYRIASSKAGFVENKGGDAIKPIDATQGIVKKEV